MYRPNNAQLLMADLASDACDAKESPDELLECIEAAEAIVRDSLRGAVQTPGVNNAHRGMGFRYRATPAAELAS